MTKHKEWCSLRDPLYCGECDCDAVYDPDDEYEEDRKKAKKDLIKKAHKQFKRESKR